MDFPEDKKGLAKNKRGLKNTNGVKTTTGYSTNCSRSTSDHSCADVSTA